MTIDRTAEIASMMSYIYERHIDLGCDCVEFWAEALAR